MGDRKANPWRPIKTFRGRDRHEVDVWVRIDPSPRSFGWGDEFRIVDAYRVSGKWFHMQDGRERELYADCITHWMPKPPTP